MPRRVQAACKHGALHVRLHPTGQKKTGGKQAHLLDGLLGSLQVKVGDADGSGQAGRKGSLVGGLVGQGQSSQGAPVKARSEGYDLVGRLSVLVVRVDPSCTRPNMSAQSLVTGRVL